MLLDFGRSFVGAPGLRLAAEEADLEEIFRERG
jgi:hypothetical protein